MDFLFIAVTLIAVGYVFLNYRSVIERLGDHPQIDLIMGLLTMAVLLEGTRRVFGPVLPGIALFFIAYAFLGNFLPRGLFGHRGFGVDRVVSIMAYSTEGIFGIPLGASATIVAMFMIFASLYNGTDAGEQFLQLSKDMAGGLRAGPAKMAVVASSLFGEYTGYMGPKGLFPDIQVRCITHRNNSMLQCILSQMPPSESSLIRAVQRESKIFSFLKQDLKMRVKDVHIPESGGGAAHLIISLDKRYEGEVLQAAHGAWAAEPSLGKFTVITDPDIDIRHPFSLQWAVGFRSRPDKDIQIVRDTSPVGLDPSLYPPGNLKGAEQLAGSKVLIDATMKFPFPAKPLPPEADMDKVARSWKEYGLT
jgi:hypothetical protein